MLAGGARREKDAETMGPCGMSLGRRACSIPVRIFVFIDIAAVAVRACALRCTRHGVRDVYSLAVVASQLTRLVYSARYALL